MQPSVMELFHQRLRVQPADEHLDEEEYQRCMRQPRDRTQEFLLDMLDARVLRMDGFRYFKGEKAK